LEKIFAKWTKIFVENRIKICPIRSQQKKQSAKQCSHKQDAPLDSQKNEWNPTWFARLVRFFS